MLNAALSSEILSLRALSYRRTVLGLGIALVAILGFDQIDYSGLNVFGVKPIPDTAGHRTLVLKGLALLLLYHLIMFSFYAYRDFLSWWRVATANEDEKPAREAYFPYIRMYFWRPPRRSKRDWNTERGATCEWKWECHKNLATWRAIPPAGDTMPRGTEYKLPVNDVRDFRIRFVWFVIVDLGLPLIVTAYAIWLWLCA